MLKEESFEYQLFKSFGLTRQGNEPRSTDHEVDDRTPKPRADKQIKLGFKPRSAQ